MPIDPEGSRLYTHLMHLPLHKRPKRLYDMDMCSGPLPGKIIRYTLPIILTGLLQLMYNAADVIVVGQYTGRTALAAVGSTGALVNLIVNLFLGLSVGVCVNVAQGYGAQDYEDVTATVHTAMCTACIAGVAVGAAGFAVTRTALELMRSPVDVIDQATLYLHIYFLGVPGVMFYNFGAAILRAIGDTTRPLWYLSASGIVNVLLNLLFVIRFRMGVAGVALATIISQYMSAALILLCLTRAQGSYHLDLKRLRIEPDKLWRIARIGLPAGIQSAVFSISNILVQSSINAFGSIAMAGNAAAANLDGFIYSAMNSVTQAAMTFTGQNIGAKQYDRVGKVFRFCLLFTIAVGLVMGMTVYFAGRPLLSIYTTDAEVVEFGMKRIAILCTTYILCGMMEIPVGAMRGMGSSLLPMFVTLMGSCVLRIIWIYTVFAAHPTLTVLYLAYPVSWLVTFAAQAVCYSNVKRRRIGPAEVQAESV